MASSISGAPASRPASCSAKPMSSVASAWSDALPTPISTGVRGSMGATIGSVCPRHDRTRCAGAPVPHHATDLAPGDGHGSLLEGVGPQAFGNVIVSLIRSTLVALEPRSFHAETDGERMELLVAVGNQVRPEVVDRSEASALAPIVEVGGHRRSLSSAVR